MNHLLSARPATAADHPHFARLFPELGVDDPVPEPAAWAREIAPATLVLEEGGVVIAYGYCQALESVGYVRQVVVAPDRRGQGVGRRMMTALAERLRAEGCTRWCLNVKPDNTAALRLYSSVGMQVAYASSSLRFDWDIVAKLPAPDRKVTARPLDPSEEAPLEAAFDLPEGQIAHARSLPGRVLLRLVDVANPSEPRVGFASFNPAFPGAFPFRVARPSLAAPLLQALRPHALAELPYMQLVAEGDGALTRILVEAGAQVRLQMLHLRGPIPGT